MANPVAARAVRLVYVRDLLTERPRTVRELAALCGVSSGAIYRDLIDLQLEPLCVPLTVEGGRWRILDLWARD